MSYWNPGNDWDEDFDENEGWQAPWQSRQDLNRYEDENRWSKRSMRSSFRPSDSNDADWDYDFDQRDFNRDRSSWSSENRDWDYGYPRDYDNLRDYRRNYEMDQGRRRLRSDQSEGDPYNRYDTGGYKRQEPGNESRNQGWENRDYGRYNQNYYNQQRPRFNYDWYDWDFDRSDDWEDEWYAEEDAEQYYGLGFRPTNYNPRGRHIPPGQQYRAAGMQSDFGGEVDYNNPDSGRGNWARGDIGYENEGAFYQDLDEPENNETWRIRRSALPQENFTGRGPTSYQRPDPLIEEDVNEQLTRQGQIDARDIEVSVANGIVMLRGSTPNREMRRLAEDIASEVTGVKDVQNEIKASRQQNEPSRLWNSASQDWHDRGSTGADIRSRALNPDRDFEDRPEYKKANPGAGAAANSGLEAVDEAYKHLDHIKEGMEVIGKQGKVIGLVKEIRTNDFLVDREMARDIYVPVSAIQSVDKQIVLNFAVDEIDGQHWEKPDIL